MSKKIKLSEVESSHRRNPTIEGRYLLDLVQRMGCVLELILVETNPVNVLGPPVATHEMEEKARALLDEIEE